MDAFRFAHPWALYLLLLVPVAVLMMLYFSRHRQALLDEFGESTLLRHLMPDLSTARLKLKAWLFLIALALQILVVAGPQFGSKLETVKRNGIEIMVALDVSNSMNAQDIQPSRLEMAKMAVARLVDKLNDDRVGMIVFAGKPYVQLPITSDYPSAKMFLQSVSTGMVATQGTAIGAAIKMCHGCFTQTEGVNRAIIVITDGENHEDDARAAAADAASEDIKVYTVGMGTTKGAPIPLSPGKSDFIKDKEGQVVITKIDEQMLAGIAQAGNGAYIPANNIRSGINTLLDELSGIAKGELEARVFAEYEDRAFFLQGLVFALLLLDLLILPRKNPRLAAFDIFTRKQAKKDMFIADNALKA